MLVCHIMIQIENRKTKERNQRTDVLLDFLEFRWGQVTERLLDGIGAVARLVARVELGLVGAGEDEVDSSGHVGRQAILVGTNVVALDKVAVVDAVLCLEGLFQLSNAGRDSDPGAALRDVDGLGGDTGVGEPVLDGRNALVARGKHFRHLFLGHVFTIVGRLGVGATRVSNCHSTSTLNAVKVRRVYTYMS